MVKINIPSKFVNPGENVQKGDIVKIVHEGKYKEGKWGSYYVTLLELPNGDKKEYTPSVQTLVNLKQEYGEDTQKWVGKELKAWVFEDIKGGKKIVKMHLAPKDWPEVVKSKDDIPTIEEGSDNMFDKPDGEDGAADEIDVKDIPF